jgi:hypothetical protein
MIHEGLHALCENGPLQNVTIIGCHLTQLHPLGPELEGTSSSV